MIRFMKIKIPNPLRNNLIKIYLVDKYINLVNGGY